MSAKGTPNAPQVEQLEHPSSGKSMTKNMPSMGRATSVVDNDCCRITKIMLMPGESRVQDMHMCNYAVVIIQPARLCFSKAAGGGGDSIILELDTKAGTCYNMVVSQDSCCCADSCSCEKTVKGENVVLPREYCVTNCGDTVYECLHIDMKHLSCPSN